MSSSLNMLLPVRQNFPRRALPDVAGAVRRELDASGIAAGLAPGARVAIAAGSRGVSNISTIVRTVAEFFRANGFRPFIFPAMGSHGGGTAEGQAATLEHYGITEAAMGCPIVSSLDVLSLGHSRLGVETFVSRDAWNADAIFLINRVKWHTSFAGPLESGVTKMAAIGLGKLEGAKTSHSHARTHGMDKVIRASGELIFGTGKVLGGLAILEDATHETAQVAVLPAAQLIEREEELLRLAKSWMPRIPVPAVDVLIVDEIGKNISGTGMDLKVVNRGAYGQYNPWPDTPKVERIFIRSLTEQSGGNAVGIGLADVVHDDVLPRVNLHATGLNARTSGSLAAVRIPLHYPSDRECIDLLTVTVGKLNPADVTIAWIHNTLELGAVALSENLRSEIDANPALEVAGPAFAIEFDAAGNLLPHPFHAAGTSAAH
ncbi:MAG TPA: hypothetical protein VHC90_00900 [Bryobacteraceae bacterium]|nr:hypothetical protein [Bryobacteraceae bacterium]